MQLTYNKKKPKINTLDTYVIFSIFVLLLYTVISQIVAIVYNVQFIMNIMEAKQSWIEKGYVDEPIPEGIDLCAEIRKMCKEKELIKLKYPQIIMVKEVANGIKSTD